MSLAKAFSWILMVAATVAIAQPAFAQSGMARGVALDLPSADDGSQSRASTRELFAVGGGAWVGTVLSERDEPSTPAFSGGFEFRPTDRLSLIAEGTWTGGYEIWQGARHDYFAYFEGKMRIVLVKSWRHQPYVSLGIARIWHQDTFATPDNPAGEARRSEFTAFVWGGGVSIRAGDFEIRPEIQLYQQGYSALTRLGASVWYTF